MSSGHCLDITRNESVENLSGYDNHGDGMEMATDRYLCCSKLIEDQQE